MTDPEARPHNPMQKGVCPSSQVKRPLQSSALGWLELWAQGNLITGFPTFSGPNAQSTYIDLLHPGPWSTSIHLDQQPLVILEIPLRLCFSLPCVSLLVPLAF